MLWLAGVLAVELVCARLWYLYWPMPQDDAGDYARRKMRERRTR